MARNKCIQDRRWTRDKSRKKRADKRQRENEIDEERLHLLEIEYRKSRKRVVKEIYRAKEEVWRELLREIDEDQWGRPYKIIMNRLRSMGLTETLDEKSLERLITKLFPRETEKNEEETTRVEDWKEEWNISNEEMCNTIANKRRNTAPGPDGITSRMWRKVEG